MNNRITFCSDQRQSVFSTSAARFALLIALCVALVGCQTTGGAKKSCLFGGGSCNDTDVRGQDSTQKDPVQEPAPLPPDASQSNSPISSARATVTSPGSTMPSDAFPNAIAFDSSNDAQKYVPNSNSPDYVQEPAFPSGANDSVVGAPSASPTPRYLSVAPAPNQLGSNVAESDAAESNESRYLHFDSPTYDSSSAPLPNELRALGGLFGFASPEDLPSDETTRSDNSTTDNATTDNATAVDQAPTFASPRSSRNLAAPIPPAESPKANAETTVPNAPSAPATNAPALNAPTTGGKAPTANEIETAFKEREPISLKNIALARAVEEPAEGTARSLYVDNAAADASITSGPATSANAQNNRIAQNNRSAQNNQNAQHSGSSQNNQKARNAQTPAPRRESRFFPGQYVGGIVDGSGARAVAK